MQCMSPIYITKILFRSHLYFIKSKQQSFKKSSPPANYLPLHPLFPATAKNRQLFPCCNQFLPVPSVQHQAKRFEKRDTVGKN